MILTTDLEDRCDVRMIERGSGPGLLHESTQPLRHLLGILAQDLDRHFTLEVVVVCEVNLTHAARAKERAHFVPAELCTGSEGHGSLVILRAPSAVVEFSKKAATGQQEAWR